MIIRSTNLMRRLALVCWALLLAALLPASAEVGDGSSLVAASGPRPSAYSLMVHAYTAHPTSQPWMQDKTPGLGLRHDATGWQAGVFCNSYSASQMHPEGSPYSRPGTRNCEATWYAGRDLALTDRHHPVGLHLLLAATRGYHRGVHLQAGPLLRWHPMPIIAPGLRLGPLRVSVLAPQTLHLSIESKL